MTATPAPTVTATLPSAGTSRRRGRRPGRAGVSGATRRQQARLGVLLVAPAVALMLVFLVFPVLNSVYYVFVDFDGLDTTPPWVGLGNLTELAQDSQMWAAARNNLIWIVVGTIGPLVLGLGLALLLWGVRRGSTFYRVVFFLPYVLPQVAVGVVWGWIYAPTRGWLNRGLEAVGLDGLTRGWLGDPSTALYAVLGTAVWTATGFVFVIILSALRNVDNQQVEAATLDGAGYLQRLRHVVLPQIMPVFLMVTALTLIGGFAVFDIIFVMTGGGPANATEVLGTYAYSNAFQLSRISYGTTLALVVTALAVPVAVWLDRLQRRASIEERGA
ncbi:raffinose/stachyose/melibiose transport system permease protein [Geodermatophilus amargosae]|uniref:Raffinose/stachyose/melibiose transport system permease protein n=1 Tax=Geodermatophilus amargosae TaxID=1296565 RepID=A0A1I7C313_9ACTN|nr:sugar ABC transporter permease [Geodermatophilus amargosae]SFT93835.1 raffinose/stachyose/melibiose transport system permease protein [Geodermatophilus amargosae]